MKKLLALVLSLLLLCSFGLFAACDNDGPARSRTKKKDIPQGCPSRLSTKSTASQLVEKVQHKLGFFVHKR